MSKSNDSEEDVSPEVTLGRLERLARLMRSANHGDGLNPAQWEALRFLAKANRFSNSPGALTLYLGATKGTISQTVKALERKGHVSKSIRPTEKRSVALTLTPKGLATLANDPLQALVGDIANLGGKTQRRFDKGLTELLAQEASRQQAPSFGTCRDCRFFRANISNTDGYRCMHFEQPISSAECDQICLSQQAVSKPI